MLSLTAGRYRLSWYGRGVPRTGGTSLPPRDAVDVLSDADIDVGAVNAVFLPEDETDWNRFYEVFEVPEDAEVEIAIVPLLGRTQGGQPIVSQQVDLAAFIVENLTDDSPASLRSTHHPSPSRTWHG